MALTIYAWRHVIDTVIFLGCSEKEDLDEVAAAKIENSTAAELQLAAGTDPHPCDQAVDPVKRIIDGFNDFKVNKFEYVRHSLCYAFLNFFRNQTLFSSFCAKSLRMVEARPYLN